ncbi:MULTISPECIES: TauD/TfdA family dioxygenase [Okeania]|uniref:Taurine catabolism dioxygenase TauD n=1 Tax=Okeania hirsuta TaxID=1458930 RepID=A0A3N6RFG8_9CYAN|nr:MULTISPECIES: TauD/TfdA family dioxygenase [Okeania]NES91251.1 taurine catabolism dioxygenase TauD [Okeania sp. SIO2B9]NET80237.1 taurine catabolism dioxygenase TauD [Okeania sp. SIO1F9]RQH27861.1 taurine catabolism dioxygenase TauD [Okeania hirsuta]
MQNENFVLIEGKRFHYSWLRDNSPQSYHAKSLRKIYDISDRTSPPKPLSIQEQDDKLIIEWDETPPHRSIFSISWLLTHAYDPQPQTFDQEVILWDKAWLAANPQKKYDSSCDPQTWMSQLFTLGFVIIENIASENLESFISSLGPIILNEDGEKFYTVKDIPTGEKRSYLTGAALEPHNAFSSWECFPLAKFLYCVQNETSGGKSLLVDSFRIAQDFRQNHPDYFQILTKVPAPFWRIERNHQYIFFHKRPIIELNQNGEIAEVRFHHEQNFLPSLPFNQMEEFYQAYSSFHRYLKNPDYQYNFRLKPGECQVIQNSRVMHGRSAYEPTSGTRQLRAAYVNWNYLVGRRNFYQYKFKLRFE